MQTSKPSRSPAPVRKPESKAKPSTEQSASSTASAIELRFQNIEKRLSANETKLVETEDRLTKRLDDGFSQVLSQLAGLSVAALPASTHGQKRAEPPTGTPNKSGPRKDNRIDH